MIPNSTCWFEILSLRFVAQRGMKKQHGCILLNSNGKKYSLKILPCFIKWSKKWGGAGTTARWNDCQIPPIRILRFQLVKEFAKLQLFGWKQPSPGVCLGDDLFENLQPNILGLSQKEPIKDCLVVLSNDGKPLLGEAPACPCLEQGVRTGVAW